MWAFFKQIIFLFVYLFFMGIISYAIDQIGIVALEAVLHALCMLVYGFITVTSSYREGKDAAKLLNSNDMQRRHMIETGEPIAIKTGGEYRAWKGYFMGFAICIPLIICEIVHAILISTTGSAGAGGVMSIMYMMFFAIYGAFLPQPIAPTSYFYLLYALPVMMVICGVPYFFGAKKVQAQYDSIKEKQRILYGEDGADEK